MNTNRKGSLSLLENIIWPILVLVYVVFVLLKPSAMLSGSMAVSIVYSEIPLGFLVLAEALVLLNGNFDLSVGQTAGLAAAIGAVVASANVLPPVLTLLVPLVVGLACGVFNGFLVGFVGLNAFLATLGTFLAFDGAQLLVRNTVIFDFPPIYLAPGGVTYVSILSFVAVLLVCYFFLYMTKYGYHYLAVGSTPNAASMLGISLAKSHFRSFVFSGILSGAAGMYFTGFTGAYGPLIAEDTVFLAFAAAVLGGISLRGGRGNVLNIFGGVILLGVISSGLTVLAISPYLRRVFFGALVLFAIGIDTVRNHLRDAVMRSS